MLCGTRAISARSVGICNGVPSTARSSCIFVGIVYVNSLKINMFKPICKKLEFGLYHYCKDNCQLTLSCCCSRLIVKVVDLDILFKNINISCNFFVFALWGMVG